MKTRPSSVQLFSHVAYLQGNGIYKVIKSYFLVLPTDHKFYMIFMAFQSLMMQEEILQGLNRIRIFKSVVLWSFLERRGCSLFPGCFLKPRILYVSLFITLRLFLQVVWILYGDSPDFSSFVLVTFLFLCILPNIFSLVEC